MSLLPARAPGSADSRESGAPAADLRFVSLPLAGEAAAGLAPVPGAAEAAAAAALAPPALQAARSGGRMIALPVAARWMALVWNPDQLADSPTLVPPHLEDWIEQLRALRLRHSGRTPLFAAWAEKEITGSFALLLAAHGGRLLDEAGRPAFDSQEGEATLQLMMRMLEQGLVQPTALETTTPRLAAALSQPAAYWLCPSDALVAQGDDLTRNERLAGLRLSGMPMARKHYQYPDAATVTLAQYRAIAVADGARNPTAAWRLARFLADPVVLRSAPPLASVLADPPGSVTAREQQARALTTHASAAPWPDPPGLSEALGRFLHAALRRVLTPREALERAALQFRDPGALPSESDREGLQETGGVSDGGYPAPTTPDGAPDVPPGTPGETSAAPTEPPSPSTGSPSPPSSAVGGGSSADGTSGSPGLPPGYPSPPPQTPLGSR
jgi:ABC-type glycerol-3-phosphate transport system substrate-binding protein